MKRQEEKNGGISSNIEALVIERWGRSKNKKPSSDYNCDKLRGKSKSKKKDKVFLLWQDMAH